MQVDTEKNFEITTLNSVKKYSPTAQKNSPKPLEKRLEITAAFPGELPVHQNFSGNSR